MIGFVSALREERRAVSTPFGLQPAGTLQGFEFQTGPECVHVCTGIGADRVVDGTRLLMKVFRPTLLMLLGYSVGLKNDMTVGKVVLDERSDSFLLEQVGSHFQLARVATCDFLNSAQEKREFGALNPHSLVADLESEAFLAEVQDLAPALVVRVVSDDVETDLPLDFSELTTKDGFPDQRAIGLRVAKNPLLLSGLLRLARDSDRATKSLSRALTKVKADLQNYSGSCR